MSIKNFSNSELLVITTAIEQLYLGDGEPRFTEKGVKALARIQARIGAHLLNINEEAALKGILPLMLSKIPQLKSETDN